MTAPVAAPLALPQGQFLHWEEVADDPTNISRILRRAGQRRLAFPVGRGAQRTPHAGWRDLRQPQKTLVELPQGPQLAGGGVFQNAGCCGLPVLHGAESDPRQDGPGDCLPGFSSAMGPGAKRRADVGNGVTECQPQGVVAVRKGPFLLRHCGASDAQP